MPGWREWIQWQTTAGSPVQVGDLTVTPLAQALIVRSPLAGDRAQNGGAGGFVWNRPLAVIVERGGHSNRLPIVDVTRIAQWALLFGGAVAAGAIAAAARGKEK